MKIKSAFSTSGLPQQTPEQSDRMSTGGKSAISSGLEKAGLEIRPSEVSMQEMKKNTSFLHRNDGVASFLVPLVCSPAVSNFFDNDVSVVLPSYNEQENIVEAIDRITKAVGSRLKEIIIVDDNSPDETWKVVGDLQHPQVRLIRRMDEKGLASALNDGIRAAEGNIVVWLDCDLGLSPEEIPNLVQQLNNYDIAIASRYVKGGKDPRPFFRVFLSWMINGFSIFFLGPGIRDYTSGFAAVRRSVFEKIDFSRRGFGEYFIEFAYKAKKNGFKIVEVPCAYNIRPGGVSKSDGNLGTLLKLGKDYGFKVLNLRFGRLP